MITFNNDQLLKDELLARLKQHQHLDTFVQGKWLTDDKVEGNGFKGCFYGCTMQTEDNPIIKFSEKYHIDLWYCYLTEKIFENLPDGHYQKFPYESIEVLPLNFNLNKFKSAWFKATLLKQLDWVTDENLITLIKNSANLFDVDFDKISEDAAKLAADSARSAKLAKLAKLAKSAESAYWYATISAEYAAGYAGYSAEYAAWSAAGSYTEYVESAARSGGYFAESAGYSTKEDYYIYLKELLFEMIKEKL